MSKSAKILPEDVQSLHGLVRELAQENELLRLKIRTLEMAQVRSPLGQEDPNQMALKIVSTEAVRVEEEPQPAEAAAPQKVKPLPSSTTKTKGKPRIRGVEKFAALPISKRTELVPEEVLARPDLYEEISQEVAYEVIWEPARLSRHEIVRKKFRIKADRAACPIIAKAPARFCCDYASISLAVQIVIAKYLEHGALHRLEKQFKRMGADISRQTQSDIVERTAGWIRPLYELLDKQARTHGYLQIDETFIKYINGNLPGSGQGYFWAINVPAFGMVLKWIPNRRHDNVPTLVSGFSGILQSDGYAAYANYAKGRSDIRLAACWAHTFRKFREALSEEPALAAEAMKQIGKLYELEQTWNAEGIDAAKRKERRAESSLKITTALKQRLDEWSNDMRILKGKFRTAVSYTIAQWDALLECLQHGHTFLDTNLLESKFRPCKIGEKNWTFIGHPEAGEKSAIVYSILATCRVHHIEPRAYLSDILQHLVAAGPFPTDDQLSPLLPHNWIAAHPEALVKERPAS